MMTANHHGVAVVRPTGGHPHRHARGGGMLNQPRGRENAPGGAGHPCPADIRYHQPVSRAGQALDWAAYRAPAGGNLRHHTADQGCLAWSRPDLAARVQLQEGRRGLPRPAPGGDRAGHTVPCARQSGTGAAEGWAARAQQALWLGDDGICGKWTEADVGAAQRTKVPSVYD